MANERASREETTDGTSARQPPPDTSKESAGCEGEDEGEGVATTRLKWNLSEESNMAPASMAAACPCSWVPPPPPPLPPPPAAAATSATAPGLGRSP